MGFLARLLGGDKAVDSVIKATVKGLDAIKYTKEERAHDEQEDIKEARKFFIDYMKSTQGSAIARRLIALIVVGCWAGCFVLTVAFSIATPFVSPDSQEALTEATNSVFDALVNFGVLGIVGMVCAFYFYLPNGKESLEYLHTFLPQRNSKGKFIKP